MSDNKPMILVFAGPNGSGKSTITQYFDKVGTYTNADDVVAAARYGFLRHLAAYPLLCLLTADAVACHDARCPHFIGSHHADDDVERYTPVEIGVKEYGTLKPLASGG